VSGRHPPLLRFDWRSGKLHLTTYERSGEIVQCGWTEKKFQSMSNGFEQALGLRVPTQISDSENTDAQHGCSGTNIDKQGLCGGQ
jgi:hypothetical protein